MFSVFARRFPAFSGIFRGFLRFPAFPGVSWRFLVLSGSWRYVSIAGPNIWGGSNPHPLFLSVEYNRAKTGGQWPPFPAENISSFFLVFIFFSHNYKNVSHMTDFNRLSPTYSSVDFHTKMSASCAFFVLLASYRLHMVVHADLVVIHSGHPPHSVTHLIHEYHVDIP